MTKPMLFTGAVRRGKDFISIHMTADLNKYTQLQTAMAVLFCIGFEDGVTLEEIFELARQTHRLHKERPKALS